MSITGTAGWDTTLHAAYEIEVKVVKKTTNLLKVHHRGRWVACLPFWHYCRTSTVRKRSLELSSRILYFTLLLPLLILPSCGASSTLTKCLDFSQGEVAGPCICGTITAQHFNLELGEDSFRGMSDILVRAKSEHSGIFEARTDKDGVFAIPIEDTGPYAVEAVLGDGTLLGSKESSSYPGGRCKQIDITVLAQSLLRVKVNSYTYPLLVNLYEYSLGQFIARVGKTLDSAGMIEFPGLRPGRYILEARFASESSRSLFYRGAVEQREADTIFVGPGEVNLPLWIIDTGAFDLREQPPRNQRPAQRDRGGR